MTAPRDDAPEAVAARRDAGQAHRLRLGNLRCTVSSTHERYAAMLAGAYGTSLLPDVSGPEPAPDLRITIRDDLASTRPPLADRLVVRRTTDTWFVESDPLTCAVRADGTPRDVAVVVHDPGLRPDWLTYHFSILFNRVLLVIDRVVLHAAALAYRGSVSLFVGSKGAGKSTISIALARAGAEVLGEDRILARRAGPLTVVSGCNDRMRVTAETERHFLAGALGTETIDIADVPKKEFAAARFFAARPHEERAVDRLFFPHVAARFAIHPLNRRQALLRLVDTTGPMLRFHDRADYAEFLSRLADLLGSLPAYELELSPRLGELDGLVELLDRQT
jgi:hypothetical protein